MLELKNVGYFREPIKTFMDYLLPFDQRLNLFIADLEAIARRYNLMPTELPNQFSFRYNEGKIWYRIIEPVNDLLIMECITLYRYHFPEGQGRWV